MKSSVHSLVFSSPIGPIELTETDDALTSVRLLGTRDVSKRGPGPAPAGATALLRRAQKQLGEYFAGRRRSFDLPVAPHGTAFQRAVWAQLSEIAFGATSTYGAIARAVGQPQAARAVGGAIGANPLAIVVPCHRVLAGDRRLTGFSGGDGVPTKVTLLTLEGCEFRA
jgi:methylated-DNA-[protein]-cysteine S-methyltransferase